MLKVERNAKCGAAKGQRASRPASFFGKRIRSTMLTRYRQAVLLVKKYTEQIVAAGRGSPKQNQR
jgi:hypothetical protein